MTIINYLLWLLSVIFMAIGYAIFYVVLFTTIGMLLKLLFKIDIREWLPKK